MTRRRTRPRTNHALPLAVLVVAVLLCGATVLPAASYTIADVDRGVEIGVSEDSNALVGLVTAENVTVGATEELAVVTNNLATEASVTVALSGSSTAKGDLSANGVTGDEVRFTLGVGESQSVAVAVADDAAYAETDLVFTVTVDGAGTDATIGGRQTRITA